MSLLTAPLLPFTLLRRLLRRPLPSDDLRPVHADPAAAGSAPDPQPAARAARARAEAEHYLARRQAELQADLEARR